jgi:hypothetical protein
MYVCLHLLIFIGLDYAFILPLVVEEIVARRYALVGFAAFLLLIPLAVTSTKGWQKRLGKRWKMLHKAGLPDRRAGRRPLHLAGEERLHPAAALRRGGGAAAAAARPGRQASPPPRAGSKVRKKSLTQRSPRTQRAQRKILLGVLCVLGDLCVRFLLSVHFDTIPT